MTRLSKSRFQKGLQCEKALWLAIHRPELASPVDDARQAIFDQGTEVGRLAQRLFPNGIEVTEDHLHAAEALDTTARLLLGSPQPIFEPAFMFDDVLVRVDVLAPAEDGTWDLFEVKSTTRVKPEHITDAAVQAYVVEGAGVPIRRIKIVHLDTGYRYEGGDYDLSRLFKSQDVTTQARAFMPSVPSTLSRFQRMLAGLEPSIRIGQRCSRPYECDFAAYCHRLLPTEHPVTELPRLGEAALHDLLDAGFACIRDIPHDYLGLTPAQRAVVEAVQADAARVDVDGLARDLARLEWPVYHLDFETVNPALPHWPGTHPYEQIPFQYSVHVHHEAGVYEHREYLHVGGGDPRSALVDRMLSDLDTRGSVTHYTSYERTRLEALAAAVPHRARELRAVIARLVDLEPVVRRNTVHPAAAGRTSIKYVLPAWCPDMSYADLAIGDGMTASARYLAVISGRLEAGEARHVTQDLLAYCGMDTLAMVRLLERLLELVR